MNHNKRQATLLSDIRFKYKQDLLEGPLVDS